MRRQERKEQAQRRKENERKEKKRRIMSPAMVFGYREAWMLEFHTRGICGGLVEVEQRLALTNRELSYCIRVVPDVNQHSPKKRWKEWLFVKRKQGKYSLIAGTRFEKGDPIAVEWGEEGKKDGFQDPSFDNIGMGLKWANRVTAMGNKKAKKSCNAVYGVDGSSVRATTRIFPGAEIVIGKGILPYEHAELWNELKWLDVMIYDGAKWGGISNIGQVIKYDKSSERDLVQFNGGRTKLMREEDLQGKALAICGMDTLEESSGKNPKKRKTLDEDNTIVEEEIDTGTEGQESERKENKEGNANVE